jgi:vacuolar-type H+-ATPase subunit I/STV1
MSEPTSSSFFGALIWKLGLIKVLGFGASLIGAAMMAVFRPPQTRKELFLHAAVAIGVSLLFGGSAVKVLDYYFDWIDLLTASIEDQLQFIGAVHGMLGAMAWGFVGGLAVMRDKIAKDPLQAVKDVKNI